MGGATKIPQKLVRMLLLISIHAPRGGSDPFHRQPGDAHCKFQSTLPVGGATLLRGMDGDMARDFNPRSPWGERPAKGERDLFNRRFQSTLPVGGATILGLAAQKQQAQFQSTLPVGGATPKLRLLLAHHLNFNPRSPWGERRKPQQLSLPHAGISIHAPRGGSDWYHTIIRR